MMTMTCDCPSNLHQTANGGDRDGHRLPRAGTSGGGPSTTGP